MKTKIKQQRPAITTQEPTVLCRYCTGSKWGYAKTIIIEVDSSTQEKSEPKQTAQEIRCLTCGMKTTKHDLPKILSTAIFKKIKEQEAQNV